jgi:hypothetical protein
VCFVGAKDPLFFFFHLAQIVFGIVSFKDPSMMMRMTSTGEEVVKYKFRGDLWRSWMWGTLEQDHP